MNRKNKHAPCQVEVCKQYNKIIERTPLKVKNLLILKMKTTHGNDSQTRNS
jgi:hypothetical protein